MLRRRAARAMAAAPLLHGSSSICMISGRKSVSRPRTVPVCQNGSAAGWELQVSSGRLVEPEELEPGNIIRTTASLSWTRVRGDNVAGFTAAYGRNDADHGLEHALLVEAATQAGTRTFYGRLETSQIESGVVTAITGGAVWNVLRAFGVEGGLGADATLHWTPESARAEYGGHPNSFHVFFRIRPRSSSGRMWNMRMTSPMMPMADPHAGHQMN